MRITVQAQAKINWALDILSRREDGYHEMDMLMQKIALSDEIRFETARWTTLTVNGHLIANAGKNLIVRAANLLNEYMGEKRGVRITLSKRIPVRAGLGGGSADCAAALMALNDLWGFKLPAKTLKKLALSLGSGCAVLHGKRFLPRALELARWFGRMKTRRRFRWSWRA